MKDEDFSDSTVEVTVSRDMGGFLRVASEQQAMLLVLSGGRLGQRVILSDQRLVIGRGSSCGLILEADSISRQHARVEWAGTGHQLVDQGSTNGTFVNEQRVDKHMLSDGDRIQVGKALLKYLAGGNIEGVYHQEFEKLVHHDALTGAHNKNSFEENYRIALIAARSKPKPISLIVFDLDHFKQVNDTYGHVAGDAVLRQLASIVEKQVGGRYLFARVGGEEFAILLEGHGLKEAALLAEQIRTAVEEHDFRFEVISIPITVSAGAAERPAGSLESAEEFYERTDQLLYKAKSSGRNRVAN